MTCVTERQVCARTLSNFLCRFRFPTMSNPSEIIEWLDYHLVKLRENKNAYVVKDQDDAVLSIQVKDFQLDQPNHMDWYPLYNKCGSITYINFNTESSDYGAFVTRSKECHTVTRITIAEAYDGYQTCFDKTTCCNQRLCLLIVSDYYNNKVLFELIQYDFIVVFILNGHIRDVCFKTRYKTAECIKFRQRC